MSESQSDAWVPKDHMSGAVYCDFGAPSKRGFPAKHPVRPTNAITLIIGGKRWKDWKIRWFPHKQHRLCHFMNSGAS